MRNGQSKNERNGKSRGKRTMSKIHILLNDKLTAY